MFTEASTFIYVLPWAFVVLMLMIADATGKIKAKFSVALLSSSVAFVFLSYVLFSCKQVGKDEAIALDLLVIFLFSLEISIAHYVAQLIAKKDNKGEDNEPE